MLINLEQNSLFTTITPTLLLVLGEDHVYMYSFIKFSVRLSTFITQFIGDKMYLKI